MTDLRGKTPESWLCVDCGINTAPGVPTRVDMERAFSGEVLRVQTGVTLHFTEQCEVYTMRDVVWRAAGMEPMGGCLCVRCLARRRYSTRDPKQH